MVRRLVKFILRKLIVRSEDRERDPVSPSVHTNSASVSESEEAEQREEDVNVEVNAQQLEVWLTSGQEFQIIDIREPYELQNGFLLNAWNIPMNSIPDELVHLSTDQRLVLACAAGMRSFQVAHYMREQGFAEAWSLDGGIADWADKGFVFPKKGKFSVGNKVLVAPHIIASMEVPTGFGRVQNVQEGNDGVVYQIGVWTSDGYKILNDITEDQLDFYRN